MKFVCRKNKFISYSKLITMAVLRTTYEDLFKFLCVSNTEEVINE